MAKNTTLDNAEAAAIEASVQVAESTAAAEDNRFTRISGSVIADTSGNYYALVNRKPIAPSNGPKKSLMAGSVKGEWIEGGNIHTARGGVFVKKV